MSVYLVDTNFFIEAHRRNYPLDVVSSFWDKIKQLAHEHKIISIDKVKSEIFGHQDLLEQWCEENLPDTFFKDSTTCLSEYSEIVNWATSKRDHYSPGALAEFLNADEADAWLVAFALAESIIDEVIIVTHEVSEPNTKKKVKIPEVCNAKGVKFCNTIEMLRSLGERF